MSHIFNKIMKSMFNKYEDNAPNFGSITRQNVCVCQAQLYFTNFAKVLCFCCLYTNNTFLDSLALDFLFFEFRYQKISPLRVDVSYFVVLKIT